MSIWDYFATPASLIDRATGSFHDDVAAAAIAAQKAKSDGEASNLFMGGLRDAVCKWRPTLNDFVAELEPIETFVQAMPETPSWWPSWVPSYTVLYLMLRQQGECQNWYPDPENITSIGDAIPQFCSLPLKAVNTMLKNIHADWSLLGRVDSKVLPPALTADEYWSIRDELKCEPAYKAIADETSQGSSTETSTDTVTAAPVSLYRRVSNSVSKNPILAGAIATVVVGAGVTYLLTRKK